MPPRRKGPSITDELQAEDIACKVEAHGEVRQNRGKRGAGKDVTKVGVGGGDKQEQVEESPQVNMATGRRQPSRRRGSNVSTPGQPATVLPVPVPNSTPKAAQSSLKIQRGLDALSAQVNHTQTATRPDLKQDQALNLRSSSRTRKVVSYNEQSPSQPSNKKPPTVSKPKAIARRNVSSVLLPSACHNEQSPSQPTNKKPPIAPKSKGIAPAKRAASSALLLSAGAKRVKEDPTSTMVETLTPALTTISHVKRGRARDQKLKSIQSHDNENSAAVMNADRIVLLQEKLPLTPAPATAAHMKRGGTRDQKLKLQQSSVDVNSTSVSDSDKMLLLQTASWMRTTHRRGQNAETVTPLKDLEDKMSVTAITQEKKTNMSKNIKLSSGKTALDQRKKQISKKVTSAPRGQEVVNEATGLEGGFGVSINGDKNLRLQTQGKGRKTDTRKGMMLSERKSDETENATVIENAEHGNDHDLKLEAKSLEKGGTQETTNAGRSLQCQTRGKGRTAATRKKTLPATRRDDTENADHSDTNPKEIFGTDEISNEEKIERQQKENNSASRKRTLQGALHNREQKPETPMIEGASDLQVRTVHNTTTMDGKGHTSTAKRTMLGSTQYEKKLKMSGSPRQDTLPSMQKLVIVDTQDWIATDVTNFGSKVYSSSEKKRKEEGRRKRARKFDALPVGFGLGITCWSPSPQKLQGLDPQEVPQLSEDRDPMINIQAQLMYPLEEAVPEEVAMLEEADNTVLRMKKIDAQPDNLYALPNSATEIQESSISQSVPKRVCGIGLDSTPNKNVNTQGGKAKVKRQVGGRTRKALVACPEAVIGDNKLEAADKLEPGIDGLPIKMQQSSKTGAATRSKRTTRSTKQ